MLEVEHTAICQTFVKLLGAEYFSIIVPSLDDSGSWLDYWQWGKSNMVKSLAESISSHKIDGFSKTNLMAVRSVDKFVCLSSIYLNKMHPFLSFSPSSQVKIILLPCITTQVIVKSGSYCRVLITYQVTNPSLHCYV